MQEYQLTPKPDLLSSWGIKWLALCEQLGMPVVLLVIYLERGDRATFPDTYSHTQKWMETKFSFDAIRLWEYRDRILSGKWPELAPLLILCDAKPTEDVLHQEVELILQSGLPHKNQVELLGIAALVASRRFNKSVLQVIFNEELGMLEEQDNLMEMFLDMGSFDRWLQDPRIGDKLQSIAKAKGREAGKAEGREEGRADAMRQTTLTFLTFRFGELPQSLVERIKTADASWCEQLFQQATSVGSLTELKLDTQ